MRDLEQYEVDIPNLSDSWGCIVMTKRMDEAGLAIGPVGDRGKICAETPGDHISTLVYDPARRQPLRLSPILSSHRLPEIVANDGQFLPPVC